MEEALRLYMAADIDLQALIGDGSDNDHPFRWWSDACPQGTPFPAVVSDVQSESREDAYSQDGISDVCQVTTRLELTLIALTPAARTSVWNAVRKRLKKFHREKANTMQAGMAGVSVVSVQFGDTSNDYVPPQDNARTGHYLKIVPLEIVHVEED